MTIQTHPRLPLYLALIPLVLLAYQNLLVPTSDLPSLPLSEPGVAMFVALFGFLHSVYMLGWRSTLVLFGITLVVSWGFEQAGVATGLVYGTYHYSDAMGPKLGHVPFAIPVAWYSMLYLSYRIALLITEGVTHRTQSSLSSLLWLAFVGGMVMTAWDVLVDPLASGPNALSWVWEHGGPFYGVPTQNFVGWVATGFTVILLYRLYEGRFASHLPTHSGRGVLALPLLAYGLVMVQLMLRHDAPSEWPVLAAFVMGLPLVAAFSPLINTFAPEGSSTNNMSLHLSRSQV